MNYEGILGLSEYAKNNALLIEQYIGNGRKTAKNREAVDLEKKVIKTIDKLEVILMV